MLGWLVGRTVSIDTLHLDHNTHRATPPFSLGAKKPSSATHLPHEPQPRKSPTGQESRLLLLVHEVRVPCGRVRARGGQGGAWRERERRPLNEASLEMVVVSKDTGRVVLRSRTCSAPFPALARTH